MSKLVLDDVASGYNLSKINANFDKIETELQDRVLYRDNPVGEPNQMESNLDMNSRDILNTGVVYASTLVLGGEVVVPGDVIAVDPTYPTQSGQAGKVLTTNGTNVLWSDSATNFSNHTDVSKGAGLVGYDQSLAYAPNTAGYQLNRLSTIAPTCGRLSNLITNTGPVPGQDPFDKCHFIPYNGNSILVNGVIETIPYGVLAASGGIIGDYRNCYVDRVAGQVLTAGFWFAYIAKVSGNLVMNFSQTGYYQNGVTWGNAVKQDDAASTHIGILHIAIVGGIPTTFGGARGQTICSYFNRFRANLQTSVSGTSITATTATKLPDGAIIGNGQPRDNFLEWVQYYDEAPLCEFNTSCGNTTANTQIHLGIGINSDTVFGSRDYFVVNTSTLNISLSMSGTQNPTDATGYYYARMIAYTSAGAASYANGTLIAKGVMV